MKRKTWYEIAAQFKRGISIKAIAAAWGLTREAVEEILRHFVVPGGRT